MARNPFEETATAGGRPGYSRPPSNRQPLLNQPPMQLQRPHPDPSGKRQRERQLQHLYGDPPYGQSDTFTNPFYPPKQHPNPRMRGMGGGLEGLQDQAGLWQDIKRILKRTKNPDPLIDQWTDHWNEQQVAEMGGYGYSPDPYDDEYNDEYGPFIPPSVLDMDLEGIGYDPADEYDFDRKRGWPGHVWDSPPEYSARGGLMSLRR